MKLNKNFFDLNKSLFLYFLGFSICAFGDSQYLTEFENDSLGIFNIREELTNQKSRFKFQKDRNFRKLAKTLPYKKEGAVETTESPGTVLKIGDYNLNHFELQFAKSGEIDYITISQKEIADGFEENPYFFTIPYQTHNAVQFLVEVNAPTTPGSSYPRSELRQVNADGTNAAFDPSTGNYWLTGKTRITHLPPVKPEVVIAQLFDGERDRVAIRTQVIKKMINLVVRINGSVVKPYLASPYELGDEFEWKILVEDGFASVFYNDMSKPVIYGQTLRSESTSWFFKAGCYSQTNSSIETNSKEYVSTELRDFSFGSD